MKTIQKEFIGKNHRIVKSDGYGFGHEDAWIFYNLQTEHFAFMIYATDKWILENYGLL